MHIFIIENNGDKPRVSKANIHKMNSLVERVVEAGWKYKSKEKKGMRYNFSLLKEI